MKPWFCLFLLAGVPWGLLPGADADVHASFHSPAEMVNSQLPKWVRLSGELRAREEGFLGKRFQAGEDDLYLLQRVRLGVQIQPAAWLNCFVQGQDSRVSFHQRVAAAPPLQDSADLRQAWMQLGGTEHQMFDLRVGRQELAFGEERLVGAGNWGNVARTFDAVRLGLHRGGYRLDIFASSVVVPQDHRFDRHAAGDNLHGLYADVSSWIPRSHVQPFVFWRLAPSAIADPGLHGSMDTKTSGVRIAGSLPARFDYAAELALQTGSRAGDAVRAWAGFWRLARTWDKPALRPRLTLEVNHASGDSRPRDGRYGTFDVLYPTPHDKYGLADQVGWRNVNHVGLIAEIKPVRSLTLQAKAHDRWLASPYDGLYNSGGALLVRDSTGASGTHIGRELDLQFLWNPSGHLSFAGGLGHIFPGEFLHHTTPGHSYTFPYVQLTCGL